jgi:hypothetical protein
MTTILIILLAVLGVLLFSSIGIIAWLCWSKRRITALLRRTIAKVRVYPVTWAF